MFIARIPKFLKREPAPGSIGCDFHHDLIVESLIARKQEPVPNKIPKARCAVLKIKVRQGPSGINLVFYKFS